MTAGRWRWPVVRSLALGLAALAAGCASTGSGGGGAAAAAAGLLGGVEVTRSHLGNNPARGEIAIEPQEGGLLGFAQVAPAVERELTRLGWTVVRGNNRSEQVALVRLTQGARDASRRGSGLVATELAVRLQRRSDGTAIWEGRAQGQARAGTPLAQPAMAADRLARALFQGFPGESGRTIRVR